MSGHPRQETILVGYGYPVQGEGPKSKVEVFLTGVKLLGAASRPGPSRATKTVTCSEWPHISPTLPRKRLRDSPSIQRVERGFVQGGSVPLQCYCSDSCGQTSPNFGGSPQQDGRWWAGVLFRECCPTLSLSGPGDPESVVSPGREPWGPEEGARQRGKKRALLPPYLGTGVWGMDATSCEAGASVPPHGPKRRSACSPGRVVFWGENANPKPVSWGLGLAHAP